MSHLQVEKDELFDCNFENCKDRSPLQLMCSNCNVHYCITHRHHGCRDDLPKGERKKLQVEQWKKPKEQFKIAKAQIDTKVMYIILKEVALCLGSSLANLTIVAVVFILRKDIIQWHVKQTNSSRNK